MKIFLVFLPLIFLFALKTEAFYTGTAKAEIFSAVAVIADQELRLTHTKRDRQYHLYEILSDDWEISTGVELIADCIDDSVCFSMNDSLTSIAQTFEITETQPATLSFKIKTDSQEYLFGFDSPYFQVMIDGNKIYEEHFSPTTPLGIWRKVFVPLPLLSPGNHTLKIIQQNTGDDLYFTTVEIASISSQAMLIGNQDMISIEAKNNTAVFARLYKDDTVETLSAANLLTINAETLANTNKIEYWQANQPERMYSQVLFTDLISPDSPTILKLVPEHDSQTSMVISPPADVYVYLIGSADTEEKITIFPSAKFKIKETITFPTTILNHSYPFIIALDSAGNSSSITNLNSQP